jgi:hypothetical protein
MAFGNNTSSLYFSVRNGKVMRYSKTQEQGTTVIPTKDGQNRYYFVYDFIEGLITGFKTKEGEIMGKPKLFFQISMTDNGENYNVEIDVDSNYFRAFAMTVLNADPNNSLKIAPFLREEAGVKKTGLFVVQHGKPCKYKYTKENPGDLPEIEVTKNKKGEIVDVDSEKRNAFLFEELNKWLSQAIGMSSTYTPTPKASEDTFEDMDDLPF